MKVFFFPPTSPFNPYIHNIVSGLECNGVTIVNKGKSNKYEKFLSGFSAMFLHTEIYHFNWIENKSSLDTWKNHIICRVILIWFFLMKLFGGKLVWTMHNRESHFVSGDKTFHHDFLKKLISRMDMIVIHAKETKDILISEYGYPMEKICYVPHGSYIDLGKNPSVPKIHKKMIFLTFGRMNRYKNIPLLIHAFSELQLADAELHIYGEVDKKDNELLDQIRTELACSNNVIFEDNFIPDERVDEIFRDSDVVVLPYDKESMINSGAAVMAMTQGKAFIVSLFGAIKDIQDKDFVYSYNYTTKEEQKEELKAIITKVYKIWKTDRTVLVEQGKEAYQYASEKLSWNVICGDIVKMYQEILK